MRIIQVEAVRLLHIRSEYGYTDNAKDAVSDEPEAVSASYQQQLTKQAAQTKAARVRDAWTPHRDGIRDHLAQLQAERVGIDLSSDLRALARLVDRIDHRIGQL